MVFVEVFAIRFSGLTPNAELEPIVPLASFIDENVLEIGKEMVSDDAVEAKVIVALMLPAKVTMLSTLL